MEQEPKHFWQPSQVRVVQGVVSPAMPKIPEEVYTEPSYNWLCSSCS